MNTSTLRGTTNTTEVDTNTQTGNSSTSQRDTANTSTTTTVPDTGFFTGENGSSAATMITVISTAIFFAAIFAFFRSRFHSGPAHRYIRRSR